eukprot:6219683-Amphidinium_carterae.1
MPESGEVVDMGRTKLHWPERGSEMPEMVDHYRGHYFYMLRLTNVWPRGLRTRAYSSPLIRYRWSCIPSRFKKSIDSEEDDYTWQKVKLRGSCKLLLCEEPLEWWCDPEVFQKSGKTERFPFYLLLDVGATSAYQLTQQIELSPESSIESTSGDG